MTKSKDVDFDFYFPKVNVQTQIQAFELLAEEIHSACQVPAPALMDVFHVRLAQRSFGMGEGVGIFDVKSSAVKKPVMAMMTFEHDLDFDALDGRTVDVMAALVSPLSDSAAHLQKLAMISRLLRCDDLCEALRSADDVDAMRVLFMPSQDWMVAA